MLCVTCNRSLWRDSGFCRLFFFFGGGGFKDTPSPVCNEPQHVGQPFVLYNPRNEKRGMGEEKHPTLRSAARLLFPPYFLSS